MPNASSDVVKSSSTVKSKLGEVEWKKEPQQMAVVSAAMMKNSTQYVRVQTRGLTHPRMPMIALYNEYTSVIGRRLRLKYVPSTGWDIYSTSHILASMPSSLQCD